MQNNFFTEQINKKTSLLDNKTESVIPILVEPKESQKNLNTEKSNIITQNDENLAAKKPNKVTRRIEKQNTLNQENNAKRRCPKYPPYLMLPTLLGFQKHAINKDRRPCYTFGMRPMEPKNERDQRTLINLRERGMNLQGHSAPAYTLLGRYEYECE